MQIRGWGRGMRMREREKRESEVGGDRKERMNFYEKKRGIEKKEKER